MRFHDKKKHLHIAIQLADISTIHWDGKILNKHEKFMKHFVNFYTFYVIWNIFFQHILS